uniref:Uncharacterized protein n=1 Tax=Cajanus cajan TaxID=3821 RepID=A0A151SJZ3_CAJCA|nr:hypothetical protein KK1_001266 [Cajanus cajan]
MEVEARRIRRFGPQRPTHRTLLPLHASSSSHNVSNTVSCWYCDYKISMFNRPLFHFGRRYSRFFKVWFSIGVGFALSALLGVTLILLWELARTLHLCGGSNKLGSFANTLFFGFPSLQKNDQRSIEAYTNADWSGSITGRRSTLGYCTSVWDNLVTC